MTANHTRLNAAQVKAFKLERAEEEGETPEEGIETGAEVNMSKKKQQQPEDESDQMVEDTGDEAPRGDSAVQSNARINSENQDDPDAIDE